MRECGAVQGEGRGRRHDSSRTEGTRRDRSQQLRQGHFSQPMSGRAQGPCSTESTANAKSRQGEPGEVESDGCVMERTSASRNAQHAAAAEPRAASGQ